MDASGRVVTLSDGLRALIGGGAAGPVDHWTMLSCTDGRSLDTVRLVALAGAGADLPRMVLRDRPDLGAFMVTGAAGPRRLMRRRDIVLTLAPLSDRTRRSAQLAHAVDDAMVTATFATDGTVRSVNENFLRTFDCEESQVIGRDHASLIDPDDPRAGGMAATWRTLCRGRRVATAAAYVDGSGRRIDLDGDYVPIVDPSGDVAEIVLLARAAPDGRVAAERARARMDALDHSQSVLEMTAGGEVIAANDVFLRATGFETADIVGRPHHMFVDFATTSEADHDALWAGLRRGESATGRFLRVGRGGVRRWIQATYAPIPDRAGKVAQVVCFSTDITRTLDMDGADAGQLAAIDRSMAVGRFGPDGMILDVNDMFVETMRYERRDQLIGRHHGVLLSQGAASTGDYAEFWAELRAGDVRSGEFQRVGGDGRAVWIHATYNPQFDARGDVVGVIGMATDITAAKEESAKFEAQIGAIARSHATVEFDLDGNVVEVNDIFLETMGYQRSDVIGKHHAMFVFTDTRRSEEYERFWADLRSGAFVSGEFRRRGADGSETWIRGVYTTINDTAGTPVGIFEFATDITAEVIHRHRVKLLSVVTDKTENSVIIAGADGRIEYVNRGFEQLTGYTLEDARGRKPGDILQGPMTCDETKRRVRGNLDRRQPFYEEILNYTRSGKPYWISLAITPVFGPDGKLERFVSIQSNIDATKRASLEFTRKLEAISSTSAIVEWNADGTFLSSNLFMEQMGTSPIDLSALLEPGVRACIKSGEKIRREIEWPRGGDAPLTLDAVFNTVEDQNGNLAKVLMFGIDTTERNELVNTALSTIKASTTQIEGIVQSIQDIGSQTRTLSLNASVEASRAGDAGRNFAVVAGEVRFLADKATEAASRIAELLKENRERADALDAEVREPGRWNAIDASRGELGATDLKTAANG